MPRHEYELADVGEYLPNDGIYITDLLKVNQVGNNRPPGQSENPAPRGDCPPGTFGKMNTGIGRYTADPYTQTDQLNPGKPSRFEIYGDEAISPDTGKAYGGGMAEYFGVQPRTVERWFSIKTKFGVQDPRNCVTLDSIGKRFYSLPEQVGPKVVGGVSFQPPGAGVKQRALMACGLAVLGGLQAAPHFTKGGDPPGTLPANRTFSRPFRHRVYRESIWACVRLMQDVQAGLIDDLTDPPTSSAWVQMTIEPGRNGSGWELVIIYFMPYKHEYKERPGWDVDDAETDGDGLDDVELFY